LNNFEKKYRAAASLPVREYHGHELGRALAKIFVD
jgi:hypothetical protein